MGTGGSESMTMQAHDHRRCVREALASAERICRDNGARLTPVRRRVLELIWESHEAVKAYDILDRLGEASGRAKPPTVYRALDFLMEQGLIHRVESTNAFVGCRHPEHAHEFQLLICDSCSHVEEIEVPGVSRAVNQHATDSGFQVREQTIEVRGLCAECAGERTRN
jgi:Fur family transcriptional regulator, zinc uptake regulator